MGRAGIVVALLHAVMLGMHHVGEGALGARQTLCEGGLSRRRVLMGISVVQPNLEGDRMKAIVDQETCTGCGLCPETCPEVFELNDSGIAFAKVDTVPPDVEDTCREAADGCPVEAITIE
jgi:ferredoxin